MGPTPGKASYKTYEAQARLVRAIVAAHPNTKWDYKEIAACYGSDMTEHALNHRFRHIRAEAMIIEEGRKRGFDMKDLAFEGTLPGTKNAVQVNEIAKYFGQSTGDGIQFQFRTIKKDAEKLRKVAEEGGDVATALSAELQGGGTVTPSNVTPSKPTPRRRAPVSGSARKRTLQQDIEAIKQEGTGDNFEEALANFGDQTPSKRPKVGSDRTPLPPNRNNSTSSSLAVRPSATPSRTGRAADSLPESSQSSTEMETPKSSAPKSTKAVSIFGPVSPTAKKTKADDLSSAFRSSGIDAYVGSQEPSSSMYTNASFLPQDGEI